MKNLSPIWRCVIDNGKLTILEKGNFDNFIKGFRNGGAELIVRKEKRNRSNKQNKYYWGVILPAIADEIGELIHEDVHNTLKSMFLKKGIDYKGKRLEVIKSTTELSKTEFEEYLEKCREWSAIELGCLIPKPNEIML